jgi:hypothetical protein
MKDACLHSSSVKPGPAPPDDEDAFPPGLDPAAGTRNEESSADRGTDSGLTVEGEDTESSVTLTMANNPRTPPTDVRLASNLPQNTGERTGGATTVVEERNGVKWRVLTSNEIERDVNGETPSRHWRAIHPQSGQEFYRGSDVSGSFTPIDYFLLMFPPAQLTAMVAP